MLQAGLGHAFALASRPGAGKRWGVFPHIDPAPGTGLWPNSEGGDRARKVFRRAKPPTPARSARPLPPRRPLLSCRIPRPLRK
eukprot:15469552-Alexandrium_andersonii.AAC.1